MTQNLDVFGLRYILSQYPGGFPNLRGKLLPSHGTPRRFREKINYPCHYSDIVLNFAPLVPKLCMIVTMSLIRYTLPMAIDLHRRTNHSSPECITRVMPEQLQEKTLLLPTPSVLWTEQYVKSVAQEGINDWYIKAIKEQMPGCCIT